MHRATSPKILFSVLPSAGLASSAVLLAEPLFVEINKFHEIE
jgi:hypothetical protein